MIKRAQLAFLLVLTSTSVPAQTVFSAGMGIGTYKMTDMKEFQAQMKEQFPFAPTVTDEFPPYVFYQGSFQVTLSNSFFTGGAIAYGSTGGRVQYRDYSGYLRADQVLQYFNVGASLGYRFAISPKLDLSVDLLPTYTYTMADLRLEVEVADEHDLDEIHLRSQSFAIQPGALLMYKMGRFGLYAQAAYYQALIKGKMYSTEDEGAYLVDDDGEPLRAGWEGIRLLLGASFLIDQGTKKQ